MEQWEYKRIAILMKDEETLNKYGKEGWEVIQFVDNLCNNKIAVWMKRKVRA